MVCTLLDKMFSAVRINAPQYCVIQRYKGIVKVYAAHRREKKQSDNERIIQVDKRTSTPIVMSTTGGMGVEAA